MNPNDALSLLYNQGLISGELIFLLLLQRQQQMSTSSVPIPNEALTQLIDFHIEFFLQRKLTLERELALLQHKVSFAELHARELSMPQGIVCVTPEPEITPLDANDGVDDYGYD